VLPAGSAPQVAYVWKTEEKGSDVNLGVHLVRDAFRHEFDIAAVLTNDTDLVEPMRIVTQELGMHLTLLTPSAKPSASTMAVSRACGMSGPNRAVPASGPSGRAR